MTLCWDHIECDCEERGFIRLGRAEQVGPGEGGATSLLYCGPVPAPSLRVSPLPPVPHYQACLASPKENTL